MNRNEQITNCNESQLQDYSLVERKLVCLLAVVLVIPLYIVWWVHNVILILEATEARALLVLFMY